MSKPKSPPEVVLLNGEIDPDVAAEVTLSLHHAARETKDITLLISSGGGHLFSGWTIAEAVRSVRHAGVRVTGRVLSHCESAAVSVLMACDHRTAMPNAWLGIHGATDNIEGADMRTLWNEMEFNQRILDRLVGELVEHSNRPDEFWRPLCTENHVHRYDAGEALEMGLLDEVLSDRLAGMKA